MNEQLLPDLLRLRGSVVAASDEFFAAKENLIKASAPAFVPDTYDAKGQLSGHWAYRHTSELLIYVVNMSATWATTGGHRDRSVKRSRLRGGDQASQSSGCRATDDGLRPAKIEPARAAAAGTPTTVIKG